ncbi:helix-turn-helix domain-containing protein [Streptomyces xinghaiensis]|uniref:helix-turn-helix domain-containing protein n=1 Tax=Streptomyces xinghaiensis TaxID=1038928 RepID=UPI0005952E79|nr:helix-turn-helix transcriptional regulator [Streptomyces xinghaiensis]MZE79632.1 helix-turn-helix domain-containing protein [Streptomyces sp. SID5475]
MSATNAIPTVRRRRLGAELRRLRERTELSATEAAARLGVPQSRLSGIEAGRYGVSGDRVRVLARNYGCTDQALVDALVGMTGDRKRGWWEEHRETLSQGLLDLSELEHHATAIRVAQVVHIPGLLQTIDQARALFRQVVPALLPHELEFRLSHRMKRQVVLHRDRPVPYTAVIHEAALRMQFGGAATSRAQIQHLIDMGEREDITVRVIPFGGAPFPCSGQGIDYFSGPVRQLDTVQIDTEHGVELVDAQTRLDRYRLVLDRMENAALSPAASKNFLHRLARDL